MKFRVIIPARLGSTRLPNKPLKEIEGKTLIQRVVEQAKKSNAESVHVATDSKEIENHCKQLDVESLLTNSNHQTCLLYTSPSPRDLSTSRMPSSA